MSLAENDRIPQRSVVVSPEPSGLAKRRLSRARSVQDLRALAQRRLPRAIFDFIDGGAEDEVTLRGNREAFGRHRFAPRALVDVSNVDTGIELFGERLPLPIIVGPTGAAGFAWPNGDVALARAAAAAKIPFCLSTSASVSIEELASAAPGRRWFQCYVFRQRDFTAKLIARALHAGYDTLIITVDFPVGGNRERDYRNDFAVPFRYTPRNLLDFATHPGWVASQLAYGTPQLRNLDGFAATNDTAKVASSVGRNYDASFDWDGLKAIRDGWPRKLLVKGIVRPDDAERLVAVGADAIAVSNHGGRQLDNCVATLDALPAVATAVNRRIPVLMDGGVRRGSDVVKAIALGADAVLIGRAMLYGLAAAGEAGASQALSTLRSELIRCMQICGAQTITKIDKELLFTINS